MKRKKVVARLEARIRDYHSTCEIAERKKSGSSKAFVKPGSLKH